MLDTSAMIALTLEAFAARGFTPQDRNTFNCIQILRTEVTERPNFYELTSRMMGPRFNVLPSGRTA